MLTKTIEVDFEHGMYLNGYNTIFKALGLGQRCGNFITREEYANGNALFLFDMQQNVGREFHVAKNGQLKVNFMKSQIFKT